MSEYELLKSATDNYNLQLLEQSHEAFLEVHKSQTPFQQRESANINGDSMSDSESNHPDDYIPNQSN